MSIVLRPVWRKPLRVSNGARFEAPLPLIVAVLVAPVPCHRAASIEIVGFSGRPLSNVPVPPTWIPQR